MYIYLYVHIFSILRCLPWLLMKMIKKYIYIRKKLHILLLHIKELITQTVCNHPVATVTFLAFYFVNKNKITKK